MDYKKSYALMWLLYFIGAVLIGIYCLIGLGEGWALAGVGFLAVGFLQTLFFFNCPRCRINWVRHRMYIPAVPHYCPYCGEHIW